MKFHRLGWTHIIFSTLLLWTLIGWTTAWYRQQNLVTAQYDLGNMEQVIWQTLHGHFFSYTSPNLGILENRAAIHTDYFLLAYTPLYVLWPDPRVLMFAQIALVASGGWALWKLARLRLSERWSAGLVGLYLLYPPLLWAVSFDVHAVVVVIPAALWAWWCIENKHWTRYALLAIVIAFTKEEAGLVVATMGIPMLFRPNLRRAGLISIVGGIAITLLMFGAVIPASRNAPGHFADAYFTNFGDTPGEIVTAIAKRPWLALQPLISQNGIGYIGALVWPLGFLPILGWPFALLALPFIGLNLLSAEPNLRSLYFHYTATSTPFLFLAAWHGMQRLPRLSNKLQRHQHRIAIGIAVIAIGGIYFWAPLPGARHSDDAMRPFRSNPYRNDLTKIKPLIRAQDRISATNNLGAQFTRREASWLFPIKLESADIIVALLGQNGELESELILRKKLEALTQDPAWTLVYQREKFWMFRKSLSD